MLLNEEGGILDDLMVARADEDGRLNIVVNGACKEADYAYLQARLPETVRLERHDDRALLALQGADGGCSSGRALSCSGRAKNS